MLEILRQRRSVRKFLQRAVETPKVEQLCEAVLRAPTSRDQQPCQFVLVDDLDLLQQLAKAKAHGTSFFETAPLAIVVAADSQKSDVWIEDCAIAAIVVQLAAEGLGLKSCWAQLRLRPHAGELNASEYVRKLVGLPDEFTVPMVIAVGYADEAKDGHPRASLRDEKLHHNCYSG